jgi:hypothetical protein
VKAILFLQSTTMLKYKRYDARSSGQKIGAKKNETINVSLSLISKTSRGKNQPVLLSLSPNYKRIIDERLKKNKISPNFSIPQR